jgi:hypothetical protein
MSVLEKFMAYTGSWRGNNRLQDPNTNTPEDSLATATVIPVLGGRFVRLDYTWEYQGQPQAGSLLIGYEAEAEVVTAHWIDTWHMGDKVMACRGTPGSNGEISVQGSYAVPPGPDWGWRTIIRPQENQSLQIIMFNIWPDGREELAVETDYTRV